MEKFTKGDAERLRKYGGEKIIHRGLTESKIYIRFEQDEFVAETMGYSPTEVRTENHKEIKNYFGI